MEIHINNNSKVPKYQQVVDGIIELIEQKKLVHRSKLPTINELRNQTNLGRVTIVNAYNELKRIGVLEATHGKGFYIKSTVTKRRKRILLLFDAMNSYKEVLYRSFVDSLGDGYEIDICFHYYNVKQFKRFVENNLHDYDHFVALTHFYNSVTSILSKIPAPKLLLMDSYNEDFDDDYAAIYQNFEADVYNSLLSGLKHIKKYNRINLVMQDKFQFIPKGIVSGFKHFCLEHKITFSVIDNLEFKDIRKNEAYLVISDKDLVKIVGFVKENKIRLGREIGLISYDDTELKSVLANGISVISTDFQHMGKMAAKMLKESRNIKIENPSRLIFRNSL